LVFRRLCVRIRLPLIQPLLHDSHFKQKPLLLDSFALLNHTTFRMPKRRESDEEHRKIVEAIEKRAPDQAEQAARAHIRNAQRTRFDHAATAAKRHFAQS